MATVSIVTITKNAEGSIRSLVRNALEIGSESVVVDTGSIDGTVEEARDAGARVVQFEGEFDYSSARNLGTRAATGDWVLHLDDDEWFDPALRDRLHATVETATVDIFSCWACDYCDGEFTGKYQAICRLFRPDTASHKGLVHEDVYPIIGFGLPNLHFAHHTDTRTRDDKLGSFRSRLARTEADQLAAGILDNTPKALLAEWYSRARHLYDLVDAEHQAGLREAADAHYQLAAKQELLAPTVRVTAAYFQSDSLRDYPKALRTLTTGISETPNTFHYQLALGRINLKECKVPEARAALNRAADMAPNCVLVMQLLEGCHAIELGLRGEEALRVDIFSKVRELYPEFPHMK